MSTPVFYHSGMAGAPAGNSRVAGGLIAILDACLVNGFNAISVTGITQTAGVASASTSGTHNFAVGDMVLIDGATPTAYNGLQTVLSKTSNSITYAVDAGTASPATGTLTAKHPAAGWAKSWAGTNQAAYRSATANSGMGHYVQIEDDNPYADSYVSARVRLCEAHSGALNSAGALAELVQISKLAGSTTWWLCADDRTCYMAWGNGTTSSNTFTVGELGRLSATDNYAFFVNRGANGSQNSCGSTFPGVGGDSTSSNTSAYVGASLLKNYSGLTLSAGAVPLWVTSCTGTLVSSMPVLGAFQQYVQAINPLTAAVALAPLWLAEWSGASATVNNQLIRGKLRGLWQPLGKLSEVAFSSEGTLRLGNTTIDGAPRKTVVCRVGASGVSQIAFDLTGPWG